MNEQENKLTFINGDIGEKAFKYWSDAQPQDINGKLISFEDFKEDMKKSFPNEFYAKGGKTKELEHFLRNDNSDNPHSCDNPTCRREYGGDYNGGYCSDKCRE